MFIAPSRSYRGEVLADRPLFYWKLDDAVGAATILDASPSGFAGTVNGSISLGRQKLLAGARGSSGKGGGTTSDWIGGGDWDITTNITVECWVQPLAAISAAAKLIGKHNTGADVQGTVGGTYSPIIGTTVMAANRVYHVVGQWDGALVRLWVNGKQDATPVAAAGAIATNNWVWSAFGLRGGQSGSVVVNPWGGLLDEIAVYPSALPARRILAHYRAGSRRLIVLPEIPPPPIVITPATATATFSAPAPKAGFPITVATPPATSTFSAPAPRLFVGLISRPPPATATFSAPAPAITIKLAPPGPATVAFSAAAPAIHVGADVTITAPHATVAFSAPAPGFAVIGVAGGPLAAVSFTPGTDWRLVICDTLGRPISIVSALAHQKQVIAHLNRPMQTSFSIAADDPRVNSVHTDGYPYLWPGVRTMKWYRRELSGWKLRFNGYVWSINPAERDPDSSVVDIAVTCFDPYQRLMKRLCRAAGGGFGTTVVFTSVDGIQIAKTLVDRTIAFKGPVGIETSGTFGHATPQTVGYDQAFIGQAISDLTDTLTMDVIFEPVDRTDGILAVMGAVQQRGANRPSVIFGYDALPHSTLGFNRTVSMDEFANDITLYSGPTTTGKKETSAYRSDAASATDFGWYEDAQVITEVTDPTLLGALADTEILLRKVPRDLVSFQPIPEKSPHPWGDWWLGDTVQVEASKNTGAAIAGTQRIYGATIDIDDQGYEIVSELVVSPDGL